MECILIGSCVVILGDSNSYRHSIMHSFKIVSMDIDHSKCPVAMNVTDVKNSISEKYQHYLQS